MFSDRDFYLSFSYLIIIVFIERLRAIFQTSHSGTALMCYTFVEDAEQTRFGATRMLLQPGRLLLWPTAVRIVLAALPVELRELYTGKPRSTLQVSDLVLHSGNEDVTVTRT